MIDLQRIWPFALAAVVLLAVAVLVLLLALLRRSARAASFADAEPEPEPEPAKQPDAPAAPPADDKAPAKGLAPLAMRLAFGRAGRRLDRAAAGDRHRVPFLLLLGGEGSRDSDLFANAGLELPFGAPAEAGTDLGLGRGFWFLDRGVVLDLAGDTVLAADGRSSDEGSWRSSLNLLQKLRPKRPVDGIVLALSCRELADAQRSEAAQEELAARAGRIYRKLWQMQRRLGFRLPVYLLVTGCERLSGFGGFSGLVPAKLRDEMIGWSSPFGPDAAYRSGWVDDAFAALGKRMDDLQMEAFSEAPAAADSLFLLPGAVRSLSTPVRVFLDQLFKPSAYHESLLLRGIYLCGREDEEAAAETNAGNAANAANTVRRTFFLKDLLNEKAFREAGLAMPATRTIIARNRAVRFAQAATAMLAILLGGGLLWASYSLGNEADLVEDFLGDTIVHLRQVRQSEEDIADADLKNWTLELLGGMAKMDFGYFGSALIPSSWFSPFHDRLRQTLTRSFDEIILQAIRRELDEEARDRIEAAALQESAPLLTDPADAPVLRIEEMPEFIAFQRYVGDMEEVEKRGRQFNKLRESRDLQPLGELVRFAFDERLPDSFYSNSRLYLAALRQADYVRFDPSRFRIEASEQAVTLADNFLIALLRKNPLQARLERLRDDLQRAAVQEPETGDTRHFADLVKQMEDVETALSGTQLLWAFQRRFNLGPAVARVRATMAGLDIFDPASEGRVDEVGEPGWRAFQRGLALVSAPPITGTILTVRGGMPEMQLSQDVVLLQAALRTFLGMRVAVADLEGRRIITELPPGQRLSWDAVQLDKATTVAAAFERFQDKGLMALPEDLRPALERVALDRTSAQVEDLIAAAQKLDSVEPAVSQTLGEDQVRAGIVRFEQSRRPVDDLIKALDRIQLEQQQRDLKAAVTSEANRLLRAVDRLLVEEKAYQPRMNGFSWWNGIEKASPAAWEAEDATGVQIYLDRTRTRIADLAQVKAQPLLTWLNQSTDLPHEVRNLTDKWRRILDDIRDYEAKKPGNPVLALEDYILNQMPKVDTRSCKTAAEGVRVQGVQGDGFLFAFNLHELSRKLKSRCDALAVDRALDLYKDAQRYFNQRLAGRYPFTSKSPGPSVPEADPQDVRAFFKLFDLCLQVFSSVPEGMGKELGEARGFIAQTARARAFFAPYLDAEKPELYPSFDIEATFRILREREVAANHIIGWTLEIGGDSITDREVENRKLRWTLGEPVRLSVRWASDGPLVPVIRTPKAGVSVHERTVVYDYRNRWSLLAALADNRAPLSSYGDEQPVTLALAVYTKPVDDSPASEAPTEVFLRLTVLAPGTTQTLDPPAFPERAPLAAEAAVVENKL